MSDNKVMQTTVAIIGATSGLLAATASIITIANGGPTIKVDPNLGKQIQESNTVSTPSENNTTDLQFKETPVDSDSSLTKEVETTPIRSDSPIIESQNNTTDVQFKEIPVDSDSSLTKEIEKTPIRSDSPIIIEEVPETPASVKLNEDNPDLTGNAVIDDETEEKAHKKEGNHHKKHHKKHHEKEDDDD